MTPIFEKLSAPFPAEEIEWRVGSTNREKTKGLALAYLTSRHIQDRLDTVVGPENWQDRYEFHGTRTVCYLSVRVDGEWITKADAAGDSEVEAEKGAVSDALKRAAVKWGIGRYLYELKDYWVDLEPAGKSYRIKRSEYEKLERLLARDVQGEPISRHADTEENSEESNNEALDEKIAKEMEGKIAAAKTLPELVDYWRSPDAQGAFKSLSGNYQTRITRAKDNRKNFLSQRSADDQSADRRAA